MPDVISVGLDKLRPRLWEAFEFGASQVRKMMRVWTPDKPAPVHTVGGKWYRPSDLWTDWTPGFYAGMMWIIYEQTVDDWWRRKAQEYSRNLERRKFDRGVHDLGFVFMSTYKRWHDLLPEGKEKKRVKGVLITAGNTQSMRYQEAGEDHYIYSFNGRQSLFIDVMMNIRLLFWAYRETGNENLKVRATRHALTTRKYLVHPDGHTTHEGIFNPETGEFRNLSTQQGWSPFTCWSRGLAWAIYGFTDTFIYTGDVRFLETAQKCADFYIKNTPPGGVPYWDYGAPGIPDEPLDSSAAAVAASGLWELAKSAKKKRLYQETALKIMGALTSELFLAKGHRGQEGILMHGVYHKPRNWGVDESVMWGDYFFMEALSKLIGEKEE
jgi:unsaturated chondroitin disaccharide hydrolase